MPRGREEQSGQREGCNKTGIEAARRLYGGDGVGHGPHRIEGEARIDSGNDRTQSADQLLWRQHGTEGDPAAGQVDHTSDAGALDDRRLLHGEIPLLTRGLIGGINADVGHNSDHDRPR